MNEKIAKTTQIYKTAANIDEDMKLINQYSIKELTSDDVYIFSVILCDNEVDRDVDKFSEKALQKLQKLFVGKTGIINHAWSAENQIARIYRTEIVKTEKQNSVGEPLVQLRGDGYIPRTPKTEEFIERIETGIVKEVSIGFAVAKAICSICGERLPRSPLHADCINGHRRGEKHDDKLCYAQLEEPTDAFEFSFVAVPAQRGAGVTKSFEDLTAAFDLLISADLSEFSERVYELKAALDKATQPLEEKQRRAEILEQNKKYMKKEEQENGNTV